MLQVDQVREEAERAIAAELAAVPTLAAEESTAVEPDRADPDHDAVLGRLLDGVRRLDQASRLTEVLDTLSELVGNEAPRAAVFTVQADGVRGWHFGGFGATLDEVEARHVELVRIPDDLEHGFQGNVNTNSGNVNTDSGDVEHGFRDVEHRFRGT